MLFEYLLTSDLPKSGVGISEVAVGQSCCLSSATSDLPKSGVGISEVSRYSCCLSTCLPQIYLVRS